LPLLLVIPQLFIVLGNDRANRFWAGALPPGEGLHPDSNPGPRGEFISRKYRLGLFRKPHPQHPDHNQLLQVGEIGWSTWETASEVECLTKGGVCVYCFFDDGGLCPRL
jgi:hypothetical protein